MMYFPDDQYVPVIVAKRSKRSLQPDPEPLGQGDQRSKRSLQPDPEPLGQGDQRLKRSLSPDSESAGQRGQRRGKIFILSMRI